MVELDPIIGGGRVRVARVGEDGQGVEAAVPVAGNGVKISGMYP